MYLIEKNNSFSIHTACMYVQEKILKVLNYNYYVEFCLSVCLFSIQIKFFFLKYSSYIKLN